MSRVLWAIPLLLVYAAGAQEPGRSCMAVVPIDSLREGRGCKPRIVENTIHATVVTLQADTQDFPNPYGPRDPENQCQVWDGHGHPQYSKVCRCETRIESVQLTGDQPGIPRINGIDRDSANGYHCSDEMAFVVRTVVSVSTSPRFISILTGVEEYCHGCGGSCHGAFELATYDAQTGNGLVVTDVVRPADLSRLPDLLTESFVRSYGSEGADRVHGAFAATDFAKAGVYVENREVWVNVSDFIRSCADGNLFPVRIPSSIVHAP